MNAGEIGFITTGIKVLSDTKVGDTICDASKPKPEPLPGFKPSKPVVFCGLFPVDSSEYQKLRLYQVLNLVNLLFFVAYFQ